MSKKDSFDNKYFIGYDTYYSGIIPLYIRLPIRNTIAKCSENSKNMVLLVYGKNILKKYDIIWNRINSLFKKEFDNKTAYKDKYIKTKTNLYNLPFLNKRKSEGEYYA